MHTFCGSCVKKRSCKAVHVPALGGLEDWFCAGCIKKLRGEGIKVEIMRND